MLLSSSFLPSAAHLQARSILCSHTLLSLQVSCSVSIFPATLKVTSTTLNCYSLFPEQKNYVHPSLLLFLNPLCPRHHWKALMTDGFPIPPSMHCQLGCYLQTMSVLGRETRPSPSTRWYSGGLLRPSHLLECDESETFKRQTLSASGASSVKLR